MGRASGAGRRTRLQVPRTASIRPARRSRRHQPPAGAHALCPDDARGDPL